MIETAPALQDFLDRAEKILDRANEETLTLRRSDFEEVAGLIRDAWKLGRGIRIRVLDEGTCELCNTWCGREDGGTWYNFYGRDQCKLDPGEGPHVVRTWQQVRREENPLPVMAEAVLWGRDASGQPVEVARQQVPSPMSPGERSGWTEAFTAPAEVTGWEIAVTQPS